MKLLPLEFSIDGRTLRQLQRSSTAAIYEIYGAQGLLYGYEVIKIRIRKESEQFGAVFPQRECYPSSSQFGRMGWSYGSANRVEAFRKYDALVRLEGMTVPAYAPESAVGALEEAMAGGMD